MTSTATTLRPDRAAAFAWAMLGANVMALALWIAIDMGASLLGWGFVLLCLVPAGWVGAQAVASDHFTVELDDDGIDVRLPWQRESFAWDDIVQARVTRVVGEDLLELTVRTEVQAGVLTADTTRAVGVVLPIRTDLAALHAQLERHLGRQATPTS